MKYFFQSMLGAMLLLSGVFAFSSCGNDESDPDSTVTIAMATVEKQPQYDAPYLVLDNGEKLWVVQHIVPYRDLKAGERIFGNYSFLEAGESGSWGGTAKGCRVSYIDYDIENYSDEYGGFRLVMEPESIK